MTTAHRPNYTPAVGGTPQDLGYSGRTGFVAQQISVQALNQQTKLKLRQTGQNTPADLARKDLKAALEAGQNKEARAKGRAEGIAAGTYAGDKDGEGGDGGSGSKLMLKSAKDVDEETLQKYDDADDDDSDSDLDSDSSDESGDEEQALQQELEKIKKEREAAAKVKEAEAAAEARAAAQQAAMTGNALLLGSDSSKVKRKWNDDVVFRNQTKGEPQTKKRFINDTIRSDFHKRFLSKYIQ